MTARASRAVALTSIPLAAAACLGYAVAVRPRIARWGATDAEVAAVLPGDELDSPMGDRPISTRAITVDAPPEAVWPWIVQMGSGRAGFYTHEWVERLLFITYADGHFIDDLDLWVGEVERTFSRVALGDSSVSLDLASRGIGRH